MRVGIYYGSTTGNTKDAANQIKEKFEGADIYDVGNLKDASTMQNYDLLIFGSSTWGEGDLQDDWDSFLKKLNDIDMNGKKVAFFGLGDQDGYGHEYISSLKQIYDKAKKQGATTIGLWGVDGYDFEYSASVVDGKFIGLALDEDNQSELTTDRINSWCEQLKNEC